MHSFTGRTNNFDILERDMYAATSFLTKFGDKYSRSITFKENTLYDALFSLYLKENQGKTLIFYLHNDRTEFSKKFCRFISNLSEDILETYFVMYGWDIEYDEYQEILVETLQEFLPIDPCINMIQNKTSAAIFITSVDMSFEIAHVMKELSSFEHFENVMENLISFVVDDGPTETGTSSTCGENSEEHSYEAFQQKMFETLGNRDYDLFEPNELSNLRTKIAYALFGAPTEEDSGYTEKQNQETEKMYDIILEVINEFSERENEVTMAVIYNCLIPLDKKNSMYDYIPVPVFVLRRCREADDPCRVFVDHTRRVYDCWQDYLEENKFCKCVMVVPEGGRYEGDENDKVKLLKLESPACGVGRKVLMGADIAGTVLGVGSTGVMAAAAIPAIAVAPIVAVGALGVGVTVGVYTIGRSIGTLIDRKLHRESVNVSNSEARAAYINIAAGAAGFAGAGANIAVSQMAARGLTIGTATRVAVNTIGVASIGINGVAIGNSAAEIFVNWYIDDQSPSTLTILQLSTSILFFGHSIYTYKTAGTIIEESQTSVLSDLKNMLQSNKQRRMFNKLELETISRYGGSVQKGRAEVISTLRQVKNINEVFAFLGKNNKRFNEMGIRFSASDGRVAFNGVTVDLVEVMAMSTTDVYSFFRDLPASSNPINVDSIKPSIKLDFGCCFNENAFTIVCSAVSIAVKAETLVEKILGVLRTFLEYVIVETSFDTVMSNLFPKDAKYLHYVDMLLSFIKKCVQEIQEDYSANRQGRFSFLYRYLDNLEEAEKKLLFMQMVCSELLSAFRYCTFSGITRKLFQYLEQWILSIVIERENTVLPPSDRKRVPCGKCSGYYFE
ncbi:hypothetical protein HHI36_020945 [Cryptolaemus montrouzieri]|uniref:DUF4781 domain-containing protein n=1 Tax=Cryptolaemus montrouzieri TaxID=559131 RepID=A0ABD2NCV7_9CUCU